MMTRRTALLGMVLAAAPAMSAKAQEGDAYARYEAELRTLLSPGGAAAAPAAADAAGSRACPFLAGTPPGGAVSSQDCMDCHGLHQTHPVDIDYVRSAQRRPDQFRSPEEVVRRGVYLPDGQVKCATCHDPRSPWKYRLALPPGSVARPAVNLGNPGTYERTRKVGGAPLAAGSAVTPTPLCLACHAFD